MANLLLSLKNLNILTKSNRINPNTIKILSKNLRVRDDIINATNMLYGDNISIQERIYVIEQNIIKQPLCKTCSVPVRFKRDKRKFLLFCSVKCSKHDVEIQQNTQQTMLKLYGKERKSIKEKTKKTCMKKYGTSTPLSSKLIKEKIKKTNLERYQHENAAKSEKVKEKTKKTCMKKYGVTSPSQHHTVKQKISKSHAKQLYGDINNPSILSNLHQTSTLTDISNIFGVSLSVVSSRFAAFNLPVHRHFTTSKPQNEINDYIQTLGFNTIMNHKIVGSNKDIDIFIPELNIGIEVNGIFWHSERNGKDKFYHLTKTELCEYNNIKLIHIYDKEWYQQHDIVKSRLANILNVTLVKYCGRYCKIISIPFTITQQFLIDNHSQGWCPSSKNYGLTINDELVSVMTFGKSRFGSYDTELLRFCNKRYTMVHGGANKLFTHFIKTHSPRQVISYSDKRWSVGNLYDKLNFVHLRDSKPNYKYFHRSDVFNLYSRHKFQKHKLKKLLQVYDNTKSEWENMKLNGYDRIWDCGNGVWLFNI